MFPITASNRQWRPRPQWQLPPPRPQLCHQVVVARNPSNESSIQPRRSPSWQLSAVGLRRPKKKVRYRCAFERRRRSQTFIITPPFLTVFPYCSWSSCTIEDARAVDFRPRVRRGASIFFWLYFYFKLR
jgi:hypothetical protein